jgi:hypothetical protein
MKDDELQKAEAATRRTRWRLATPDDGQCMGRPGATLLLKCRMRVHKRPDAHTLKSRLPLRNK